MNPSDRTGYRVESPPQRPLLLYDGDCGFCKLWVDRWRGATRGRVDYAPAQSEASRFPEIPNEIFEKTVVFVRPDGRAVLGAAAVLQALASVPSRRLPLWIYDHVPGASHVAEAAYGVVAGHRKLFSKFTRALWGRHARVPQYGRSRCLFIRLMGLVYVTAFASLWPQLDGLAGHAGILPVERYFEAARQQLGPASHWVLPSLLWIQPSDLALHVICGSGILVSLLLLCGLCPAGGLILAWVFYLSLTNACGLFLGYQWDNLLLEAGFAAIFIAPLTLRCGLDCRRAPPRSARWLLSWLLFRLMFSSGFVKLASGDPNWRHLAALDYHYETQPLPIWTSWYAHNLPQWTHTASTAAMFAIELGAPFLIFAPRRLRMMGCALLVFLQIVIAVSANYAFFNLLTIVLCVLLLDDAFWSDVSEGVQRLRVRRAGTRRNLSADPSRIPGTPGRRREWPAWILAPVTVVLTLLGVMVLCETLRWDVPWPRPLLSLARAAGPFRSVNAYGLFAVMTTERDEIVVEGSNDGKTWIGYEFRWKPGDLMQRPGFVAPHQPRVDWQMWFAALSDVQSNPWFVNFMARLMEGSPPVLSLLARNPFPQAPPKYVRAMMYTYHFTTPAERRATGAWWRRQPKGTYCPPLSLDRGDSR